MSRYVTCGPLSPYLVAIETQGVEGGEGGNPAPINTVYLVTRKEEPERKEAEESMLAPLQWISLVFEVL